ncbi:unnamed protein product [Pedinophyceae sp. YPF-701]|nr:unnamed protein product [Pedinophyceae sp. YPF-701]
MPASTVAGAASAMRCTAGTRTAKVQGLAFRRVSARSPLCRPRKLRAPAPARRCRAGRGPVWVAASAAQPDYYAMLGVQPSATLKEVKQAFKKKALKLHPDVNKAPDAQERFLEMKEAYSVLSDTEKRRQYDFLRNGGIGADWGTSGVKGDQWGGFKKEEEEFYGLDDFFRDLDEEYKAYRSRRGAPKSLWEELGALGEEFVEFLEQESGIADPSKSNGRGRAQSGPRAGSGSARASQEPPRRPPPPPPPPPKKKSMDVDDELAALKKKLGM